MGKKTKGESPKSVKGGKGATPTKSGKDSKVKGAAVPNKKKGDDRFEGPPIGVLNRRGPKQITRHLDPHTTTIWNQLAAVTEETFKPNVDAQSGPFRAIVLAATPTAKQGWADKDQYDASDAGFLKWIFGKKEADLSVKKLIQLRCRIPELHMHLPVPINDTDFAAISQYPTFTAQAEDTNNGIVPKPGEIVIVDFGDKINKKDGVFIRSIRPTQSRSGAAGAANCPPPASPASMGSPPAGGGPPIDMGKQGPVGARLKAKQPGQTVVIFGDSQAQGGMGCKISGYFANELGYKIIKPDAAFGNKKFRSGCGRCWARHSSKPKEWSTPGPSPDDQASYKNFRKGLWHMLEPMLKQKPSMVVVIGGNNGARPGDAKKLINKIRSVAGNVAIAWFSAPTAVPTKGKKPFREKSYTGSPGNWVPKPSYIQSRLNLIETIRKDVQSMSNTVFVKTPALTPNYNKHGCGGCDGIHMPSKNATELVTNLKAAGSPTPGGENLDFLNSMKNTLSGLAKGAKKVVTDALAVMKKLESQYKKTSLEDAKKNMKEISKRLDMPEASMMKRDWYSGYKIKTGSKPKASWAPPTYFEIAKMFGFQSPNKEALGENIVEMENHFIKMLDSKDEFTKKWAENVYSKEVQKAKQLYSQMGNVNMSLPGKPFPRKVDAIKALQVDMALRITAYKKIIKSGSKPKPTAVSAGGGGGGGGGTASSVNCGNASDGSYSAAAGAPLPTVNIEGGLPEGTLSPEETMAHFMTYGKKFGFNKYEMIMLAACVRNESGRINAKTNRIGNSCVVRLEPHVSAKKVGCKCKWACCSSKNKACAPFPCTGGVTGWKCKGGNTGQPGDGKFPGSGWGGVKVAGGLYGNVIYKSLTPGIAQSFWWSKFAKHKILGSNPGEYIAILRTSHAAQIFALFAFVTAKERLRKALSVLQPACVGHYYNGAKSSGKLSAYSSRVEMYCRGITATGIYKMYDGKARAMRPEYLSWLKTHPPSNIAAVKAAKAGQTTYSLSPEDFKPNPSIGSDIIMAQYDNYKPAF